MGEHKVLFFVHSVADIETLVDKKHFDVNMIILWKDSCPKLAGLSSLLAGHDRSSGGEIRDECLKKVPRRPKIRDECLSEKKLGMHKGRE